MIEEQLFRLQRPPPAARAHDLGLAVLGLPHDAALRAAGGAVGFSGHGGLSVDECERRDSDVRVLYRMSVTLSSEKCVYGYAQRARRI